MAAKMPTGHETKLALWNHAGDDLYSMFARSPRIVDRMEQVLGGEVYLYHMKMMLKEPRVGGAWEWHQDYGYWYHNGCLLPLLASCLIAVSRANQANGCLQVLRGSHLMGRIDHGKTGDQTGRRSRTECNVALERMELVYVECEPGDAIFLRQQPAAPQRHERVRRAALVADLLLQRAAERPVQGIAPSAVLAAGQGGGRCDAAVAEEMSDPSLTNDAGQELQPQLLYRVDGDEARFATWELTDGHEVLALFTTIETATKYRSDLAEAQAWNIYQPPRDTLIELLQTCRSTGILYAALDPSGGTAKTLFDIPQVLAAVTLR